MEKDKYPRDELMKKGMKRKIEGKRGRERNCILRISMVDNLLEKEKYGDLKRRAENWKK